MQIPPFSVSSGTEKEEFSAEEGGGGQVKGKRFNTLISITEKKKIKNIKETSEVDEISYLNSDL